jgi:nucleoside-diphosphate-sugar epimerase
MKVVVTGGAGFIGSHLVKKLIDGGRDVVVIDDLSRGSRANLLDLGVGLPDDVQIEVFDLRNDGKELYGIMDGACTVFHLAARIGSVDYLHGSNLAELMAFQDNVRIDANVFRACMKSSVDKIVYASSVSVYPMTKQGCEGTVFNERDMNYQNPDGGYGWAKMLGEYQLGLMDDTKISIARIFNIYGPCSAIDETAQVIPALIRKAVRYPKEDFVVWGTGKQSRDFTYVSDCVDALILLEKNADKPPLIVNVGSGVSTYTDDIAQQIKNISNKTMLMRFDRNRTIGTVSRTADVTKLLSLGWKRKVTLDEGLRLTYKWLEKRLG